MSDGLGMTLRESEKLNQADTMDVICTHILMGGSLVDLAETWEIPFGRIRLWMAADETRDKAYIKVLNMRAEMQGEKIKRELDRIAYADFRKIYNEDGTMKPFSKWPDDVAAAVSGLTFDKGNLVDFKRTDKRGILELAGKAIAMFSDKLTVDGKMDLEQMLVLVDKQARALMSTNPSKVVDAEAPK